MTVLEVRATVVLGCAVSVDRAGRLSGALARRIAAAAEAYARECGDRREGDPCAVVVACGGRRWSGVVEADAMARELTLRGVPERAIVRERCSLTTRENARFAAAVLARRGLSEARLVTCAWHLPRALRLFEREGVRVLGLAAAPARTTWARTIWRWGRERLLTAAEGRYTHPG
jgi:uncharacterized SAM-binding protein YcdF (DUF218 family)